jgi:acyl carrier protein
MTTVENIRRTVLAAIDELNELRSPTEQIAKSDSTSLVGPDGALDSLGLVNLIALLEQRIEDDLGRALSLVDSDLMMDAGRHFADVGSVVTYLAARLTPDG